MHELNRIMKIDIISQLDLFTNKDLTKFIHMLDSINELVEKYPEEAIDILKKWIMSY